MVKVFDALVVGDLEKQINAFGNTNPHLEIVAISHANVVKTGPLSFFQWNAIVVYRRKL